MSGISYRDLPRIATLHQVGVEGGQHGFRHGDKGYNIENTHYNDSGQDNP